MDMSLKAFFMTFYMNSLICLKVPLTKNCTLLKIKWLSWMLEWVFEGGLTQEQNGMLPKIKTERGKLEYVCSEMYVAFQSCQN